MQFNLFLYCDLICTSNSIWSSHFHFPLFDSIADSTQLKKKKSQKLHKWCQRRRILSKSQFPFVTKFTLLLGTIDMSILDLRNSQS